MLTFGFLFLEDISAVVLAKIIQVTFCDFVDLKHLDFVLILNILGSTTLTLSQKTGYGEEM